MRIREKGDCKSRHAWPALYVYEDVEDDGRVSKNLHICIPYLLSWFIELYITHRKETDMGFVDGKRWGFTLYWEDNFIDDGSIHLHWGKHSKLFDFFTHLEFYKMWYEDNKGILHEDLRTRYKWASIYDRSNFQDDFCEVFPFRYVTKEGKVQNAYARVHIEIREWRRMILPFTKKWNLVHRDGEIEFYQDPECTKVQDMGEKVEYSWKGGVTAFGVHIGDNETKEDFIKRIEANANNMTQFTR